MSQIMHQHYTQQRHWLVSMIFLDIATVARIRFLLFIHKVGENTEM
jgi:hypothetical protein